MCYVQGFYVYFMGKIGRDVSVSTAPEQEIQKCIYNKHTSNKKRAY